MTEAEWLAATDVVPMLAALQWQVSDRKVRLLCCGWVRLVRDLVSGDEAASRAVEIAEGFADARRTRRELTEAKHGARQAAQTCRREDERNVVQAAALCASEELYAFDTAITIQHASAHAGRAAQCDLLRDLVGNPFRPVAFDPDWRGVPVLELAAGMYESGNFGELPELADALQDAGCDNDDVLDHCRGPGPHVRGCWVTDLVLGKV